MIIVASPCKPFTYTAKGTVRRPAVIANYDDEINELYNTVALTTQTSVSSPSDWSLDQTKQFVRTIIANVLTTSIDDDVDLFQNGCDRCVISHCPIYTVSRTIFFSLQATWIRNAILRAVRETMGADVAGRLPGNIVYQFPTASSLASFVSRTTLDVSETDDGQISDKINEIQAMVKKYSSDFLVRPTDHSTSQNGVDHLPTLDDVHSIHQGIPRSSFIRALTVDLPYRITKFSSRLGFAKASPASSPLPALAPSQKQDTRSKRGHSRNLSLPVKLSSYANKASESFSRKKDVVLVTGTTGGFGANVLYHLAFSKDVTKIFALNRKPADGISLLAKQSVALQSAFNDVDVQWLERVTLLEGDLTAPGLGLDTEVYEEVVFMFLQHVPLIDALLVLRFVVRSLILYTLVTSFSSCGVKMASDTDHYSVAC